MFEKRRKSATLRARCEPELRREVERLAQNHGLDPSDLVRMACVQFIRTSRRSTQTNDGSIILT